MKISEMTTEQVFETLCVITPYVSNISTDEKLSKILKEKITGGKKISKAEIMVYGARKVSEIVPLIFEGHKEDLFGILSALNGKTPEQIAKQNFIETMKQVRECANDKELIDFFKSWQQEPTE